MHWKCLQSEQGISKLINNTVGRSFNRSLFHSIFKIFPSYITSLWKWPFLADNLSNSLCFIGCQTLLCPTTPTRPIFYWIRSWNFSFLNVTEKYIKAFLNLFCGPSLSKFNVCSEWREDITSSPTFTFQTT